MQYLSEELVGEWGNDFCWGKRIQVDRNVSSICIYIDRADMMDGRKEGKSKSDRTRDEVFSHIQNILLQENLKRPPYCVISYTKTYHILFFLCQCHFKEDLLELNLIAIVFPN